MRLLVCLLAAGTLAPGCGAGADSAAALHPDERTRPGMEGPDVGFDWSCTPSSVARAIPLRCRFWSRGLSRAARVCGQVEVVCGAQVVARHLCPKLSRDVTHTLGVFYPPVRDPLSCDAIRFRTRNLSCNGYVAAYHSLISRASRGVYIRSMPARCRRLAMSSAAPPTCDDWLAKLSQTQPGPAHAHVEKAVPARCRQWIADRRAGKPEGQRDMTTEHCKAGQRWDFATRRCVTPHRGQRGHIGGRCINGMTCNDGLTCSHISRRCVKR